MGRNRDTKHMCLCTVSKTLPIRWPGSSRDVLFFPLASLCARTQEHVAGWTWLPALCLDTMAGCLLRAGHGRFGDAKPADSHSVHALPQFPQLSHRAEATPFPRLLGGVFCGSLQSLQALSLAALWLLNLSQPFRAGQCACALTCKQPVRTNSQRCCQALPMSLLHFQQLLGSARARGSAAAMQESHAGELPCRARFEGCQAKLEEPQCQQVLGMRHPVAKFCYHASVCPQSSPEDSLC